MNFEGTFIDGHIVPDSPPDIPEGARVRFEVVPVPAPKPEPAAERLRPDGKPLNPLNKFLLSISGTVSDLPSDMARNHDHYIHGTPKR
jgi:hypothetical protein